MNYFCSIENTTYFHWQVSLLIQSFIEKNLQDKLLIAVAESDTKDFPYGKILSNHKRKFLHKNYNQFNLTNTLIYALENSLIEQPFCVLNPDMILINEPILEAGVSASKEYSLEVDEINESILDYKTKIEEKSNITLPSLPLGDVVGFKDLPISFFKRIQENIITLIKMNKTNLWKTALLMTIYEQFTTVHLNIKEHTLLHNNLDCNFINYKHGIPNVFHKKFHAQTFLPYQMLLNNNISVVTNYIGNLIGQISN